MKTVLVTGVLGGIGRAIADCFGKAGWRVVGVDRRAGDANVDTYVQLDIAAAEAPGGLRDLIGRLDRLDAVVNNAAIQIKRPLAQLSLDEWDLLFATNVRAAFVLSQASLDHLTRARGAIVNVSSVHAQATSVGMAAYAATKAALVAFTRAAALEFGSYGVRVNAVLPGAVDTPMLRAGMADAAEGIARISERTALGRVARPEEVARAVLFLAGDDASFVTGQALVVDGGALARLGTE